MCHSVRPSFLFYILVTPYLHNLVVMPIVSSSLLSLMLFPILTHPANEEPPAGGHRVFVLLLPPNTPGTDWGLKSTAVHPAVVRYDEHSLDTQAFIFVYATKAKAWMNALVTLAWKWEGSTLPCGRRSKWCDVALH